MSREGPLPFYKYSQPHQACKTVRAGHLLLSIYLAQDLLYGLLISTCLEKALLRCMPVAAIVLSPLYRLQRAEELQQVLLLL